MVVKIIHEHTYVTVSIQPETSRFIKGALLLLNITGLILIAIALADWLLGLLVIGVLWSAFFGCLTLWNFYGKELLTINTKLISYQRICGLYKTAVLTKKINHALNISLVEALEKKGHPHFNLIFESYNDNDLPEELFRTTLAISQLDLERLKAAIRRLYFKKTNLDLIRMSYQLN